MFVERPISLACLGLAAAILAMTVVPVLARRRRAVALEKA